MRTHIVVITGSLFLSISMALAQTSADGGGRRDWRERLEARKNAGADQARENRQLAAGTHDFTLMSGGKRREYRVHVPKSYSSAKPTPVVFSFHGGGGDMQIQSTDAFYQHISKSESAGFIAVFPNGFSRVPGGKLATWNAGTCCGKARDENVDDIGFIREVLRKLQTQVNVDAARVFADGISNGGMISYRIACELPGVFRAIAAVAATDGTSSCTPTKATSILHIHALDDDHVGFNGGAGRNAIEAVNYAPVPSVIEKWKKLNGCTAPTTRVLDVPGASCDLTSQCSNNTQVKLCVTQTGGHSWPGGQKPRGNGTPSTAINATDMIWDFFSRQ